MRGHSVKGKNAIAGYWGTGIKRSMSRKLKRWASKLDRREGKKIIKKESNHVI
jgi:hypothetical protein